MTFPLRRRPAGTPAATPRPGSGGVGRSTSAAAERVSDDLRRGAGEFLRVQIAHALPTLGLPAVAASGTPSA